MIDHPPGEECQWDWLELRDTPWYSTVFVLVGVLSHSGRFRAWISSSQDQPHLVEGSDAVLQRFGGTARRWRVDRVATVLVPGTDRIQPSFVGVAEHYGRSLRFATPNWWQRRSGGRFAAVTEKSVRLTAGTLQRLGDRLAYLDDGCVAVLELGRDEVDGDDP